MASSAWRGAARAEPTPDQLASFYKLVEKKAFAGALDRHARTAELSALASTQAEALFGDDSLVVASLRKSESIALSNLAFEVSGAEQMALDRRSFAVLVLVIPILLRRLAANTLLPGTLREEELDYEAHAQASVKKAVNKPVPSSTVLRAGASTLGYDTLIDTMFGLKFSSFPNWVRGLRVNRKVPRRRFMHPIELEGRLCIKIPAPASTDRSALFAPPREPVMLRPSVKRVSKSSALRRRRR